MNRLDRVGGAHRIVTEIKGRMEAGFNVYIVDT